MHSDGELDAKRMRICIEQLMEQVLRVMYKDSESR